MNNRKVQIALGLVIAVLAIVSVFILFSPAFGASDANGYPSSYGSCYKVMFGTSGAELVPALIAAFILQLVAIVFALFGAALPGKLGAIGLGFTGLLLVIAGIFWALAPTLFLGANPGINPTVDQVIHGTGTILAMVFTFLPGLLSFYGAYRVFKA